jgi:tetratricopeptide (TPR) repeat protein
MDINELIQFFENNPFNASLLGGEHNPKAMAYSALAKEAQDRDDFGTAISHYSKALEFQPLNSHILSQRAICYRMLDDYDKSLIDASNSKKIDDNFSNNQTIALCYLFKKDFLKAIKYFDTALKYLDSYEAIDQTKMMGIDYAATKSRALNNQAICYYNLQQLEEAIKCATKGIQAKSDYSNNYFIRGMIYLSQGNKTKAISDLQIAAQYGYAKAQAILAQI